MNSFSICTIGLWFAVIFLAGNSLLPALAATIAPKPVVLPVTKDASTQQFIVTVQHKTPLLPDKFVVDIGSGYLWVYCDEGYKSTTYRPARCGSPTCKSSDAPDCDLVCQEKVERPGCTNNTCTTLVGNTLAVLNPTFTFGLLADDVLVFPAVNGRNPALVPHFVFVCGPNMLLQGLAAGAIGMLGLGRRGANAPTQLATALGLKRKFLTCLPSGTGTASGVIVVGDDPALPKPIGYTKLLENPVTRSQNGRSRVVQTSEYYVGLSGILVSGKLIPLNATLLHARNGAGGTKISTTNSYARLESSIYSALEAAFVREAAKKGIARVPASWPFGACFSSKNATRTNLGWAVPEIELRFSGAGNNGWKIFGANSMKEAGNGVMCLAFTDAGMSPDAAVVIGGHQLEDTVLQFDLENGTMGFSSTLLLNNTNCAKIKFLSP